MNRADGTLRTALLVIHDLGVFVNEMLDALGRHNAVIDAVSLMLVDETMASLVNTLLIIRMDGPREDGNGSVLLHRIFGRRAAENTIRLVGPIGHLRLIIELPVTQTRHVLGMGKARLIHPHGF